LRKFRGFTETLLDGALEDKKNNRRFVEIIRNHAIRLSDLTTDLLTLATLDSSDSLALRFESVDLKALLEDALETVRPLTVARKQKLEARIANPLPEITCDRDRLRQVFLNLLDNAIKFTGESGQISLEADLGSDGSTIEIHVRDTGPGIPSSDLPRIFERFYRVDKTRSRELGGMGLGLAIVKHIVEAHKGRVEVNSALGQG
jgi:two-component system, OmpR family, phosphate regulon sensor histidine kinase PhoR